jgi:signal transduction histidine kinase
MRGWLAAPLTSKDGGHMGVIQLSDKYEGEFSEEDEAIAMQMAQMASVAITNAHLFHHAQEAVKLRDEFLSIASHEFRTPLTSLVLQLTGLLRSARRGEFGEQRAGRVADRLESAYGQSLRLSKLVNELLDVSRISAGKLDFELEEVELSELVHEVVDRFEDELREAYCTVNLNTIRPATGMWDRFRLDQVVANLLSNAVKYGRGQPVEITVDSDGEWATLRVRDHGIGIKPEHLERIFDRFERGVTTRNYGGLGLGLYIVRSILDAMGGTIRVDSLPGQGATFIVELPLGSK